MSKQAGPIVFIVVGAVILGGCLGPKPVLQSYQATPPAPGSEEPFRVEAVVSNEGPGAGQVAVEVELTNKESGEVIRQEEKDVELQPGEVQHVLFEMSLPASAKELDPQSIEVEVEAHYPIE